MQVREGRNGAGVFSFLLDAMSQDSVSLCRFKVLENWGTHLSLTGAVALGGTGLPLKWTKRKAPRRENGSWQQPSLKSAEEIPPTWLSCWSHWEPGLREVVFFLGTMAAFLVVSHSKADGAWVMIFGNGMDLQFRTEGG